jgi:uncharacterized membrane protein YedE/YeeE
MKALITFIVGFIFAIGLSISGMTQPHVVRGFLDIFGAWNYSLMGVMGGAIALHSVAFYLIRKRSTPLLDAQFHIPTRKDIDWRLLAGAAIFGLGWGWAGICPGPSIVAAVTGDMNILWFIASMLGGMALFKAVESKIV